MSDAKERIVSLSANNVKKLRAVTISPDATGTFIIGGNNGQGKSSVLDSVIYAIAGKSTIPSDPIRHGESKAEIILETETLVVKRVISQGGDKLEVRRKDGVALNKPQSVLDDLIGPHRGYDPMKFIRDGETPEGRRRQAKVLRDLAGLDFTKIDADIAKASEERKLLSAAVKADDARLAPVGSFKDVPDELVNVADLMERMRELDRGEAAKQTLVRRKAEYEGLIADNEIEIRRLADRIAALKADIADKAGRLAETEAEIAKANHVDCDSLRAGLAKQIESVNAVNLAVMRRKENERLIADRNEKERKLNAAENKIEQLTLEKAAALSSANMPIPGLSFDADGIRFNGVPFDQCSSAEQMRVAVAIGAGLNPSFRVVLIHDGSLLDEASLAELQALSQRMDLQVLIERVGHGAECDIVIEDGSVVSTLTPAPVS